MILSNQSPRDLDVGQHLRRVDERPCDVLGEARRERQIIRLAELLQAPVRDRRPFAVRGWIKITETGEHLLRLDHQLGVPTELPNGNRRAFERREDLGFQDDDDRACAGFPELGRSDVLVHVFVEPAPVG